MFIVCFGDGLGNQMFQYAFYLTLKKKYPNNDVAMDIFRIYGGYIHNGFELEDIFKIKVNSAPFDKVLSLSDHFPNGKIRYKIVNKLQKIRRYLCGPKSSYITQDDPTAFYKEVFLLSELNSYIFCGNWVNENYFRECKEELYNEFVFPDIKDSRNMKYKEMIETANSVSVHIRKGDYINSGMINLSLNYYKRAKEELEKEVHNPKYFIFTDDKEAIGEYLELFTNSEVIEGNGGKKSYIDMQLMSLCKHNIIANSTFSFWGAYLNKNSEKVVVAPDRAKLDFKYPFALSEWVIIPYE